MKRSEGWGAAFAVAAEGIGSALHEQRHMRVHWVCASAVLVVASGAGLDAPAEALVLLAAGLVLGAELFNTALEAVVDLAAPALHPLAKQAKDAAAGAVLVLAVSALLVLVVLVVDHWDRLDAALVRSTVFFGVPFLLAQTMLLVPLRGWLRGAAMVLGTAALALGCAGAGQLLYLVLLGGMWIATVRLTSGWA